MLSFVILRNKLSAVKKKKKWEDCDQSLSHSVTHSVTQSLTHSLTHSLSHLLSHLVAHSVSWSCTQSINQSIHLTLKSISLSNPSFKSQLSKQKAFLCAMYTHARKLAKTNARRKIFSSAFKLKSFLFLPGIFSLFLPFIFMYLSLSPNFTFPFLSISLSLSLSFALSFLLAAAASVLLRLYMFLYFTLLRPLLHRLGTFHTRSG